MYLMPLALAVALAVVPTVPPSTMAESDSRRLARLDGQGLVDDSVEQRFDRALTTIDRHCVEAREGRRGQSSIADIVIAAGKRLEQQQKPTRLLTIAEAWALAVAGFPATGVRECVSVAASLVVMIEESH